jgi:hypothetical protein
MRNAYKVFDRNHKIEKPSGRPGHRLNNNSTMDLKEIGNDSVDWFHYIQQGSMKDKAVLGQISNYKLLKKDSAS